MRLVHCLAAVLFAASQIPARAASSNPLTPGVILIAISYVDKFCPELMVDEANTVQTLANLGFSNETVSQQGIEASISDAKASAAYIAAKAPNHVEVGCANWYAMLGPEGTLAHSLLKIKR